ncbi:hypothetical protein RhiirA4_499929 [Rhizophagus irregularis]|uniref:Uncharacterized protein n=1 Tax=Rhizophagus irregularis TaxID=588596 RepID=A0A2I1H4W2_9GLOM|nr:hypothetical protein RhiirA4_499929 [Rhizophagus irregularis]
MAEGTRSKNAKRNNQKTQFESHTNLSDEEMVVETYGKDQKDNTTPNISKKKQKMSESASSPSSPNTKDNGMDIDDKTENEHPLSSESDAPSRDVNSNNPSTPIIASQDAMDTDQQINGTISEITQGSTSTQTPTNANNDITSQTVDLFKGYNSRSNTEYVLFFMRNIFDKEKSNNEILNDLKNAYLTEHDIISYRPVKRATIEFFTILVGTEATFNRLKEKPVSLLNNAVPQIFSNEKIDELIKYNIDNLKSRSINLLNVPINYDINLLIKHLANFTSNAIDSYKEYIPNKRTNIRNLPPKLRFQYKAPTYKRVTLTFNKSSAVEYLLSQHKWGILIENFLIRITPIDEDKANFKARTTPTYVVTGIPLNATVLDLLPLTDHLKARSIELLPTKSVSLHKIANIYCNTNDQDFVAYNKFNTFFQEFKLHIYPAETFNLNDTCGYCGLNGHNVYHCTEENYTIIPHNQERKFRKKFIKRPNSYNLNDEMKHSYEQIRSLTASQKNRPRSQKRPYQDPSYNQTHMNGKDKENSNRTEYPNRFQRRSQALPHGNLYNWDESSNLKTSQPSSSRNNKQTESSTNNGSNADLLKRIVQLETIIKELNSEVVGLNVKQKQQAKDITLLQEQERRHQKDMALLNQHLVTINNNMAEQKPAIASIPKIVTMLENMEKFGMFSQMAQDNNNAYGNDNYSYPPHSSFTEEQQQQYYNEDYEDSNSGYESSGTVETHDIFPDPNYTPSKPTGGYPTITSAIGNSFSNFMGYGQDKQQ